jgi:ubiquinone/menaquinone biosynthesis C-methylase UbiE
MAHKFNPAKLAKLENPDRLKLFPPVETFRHAGIRPGMTVLDIGTGSGFYLPPLAETVGEKGRIIGIDTQTAAIDHAAAKIQRLGLENIELLATTENAIPLPPNSIDAAVMIFLFHELETPQLYLRELARHLTATGKLIIIEWSKEERDMGPPPEEVPTPEEITCSLAEAHFTVQQSERLNAYCHLITALPAHAAS